LTFLPEKLVIFGNFDYWSSTESDANQAYYIVWFSGEAHAYDKFESQLFRGVKYF
jgi:hypothetical protein